MGFIEFYKQTGIKITGLYSDKLFTCHYVLDGKRRFPYKGKEYGIKYFDGCFMPYVVELSNIKNCII